jgi:hypothetical protein
MLDGCLAAPGATGSDAAGELAGIAAPHVGLDGGRDAYAAAYRAMQPEHGDRVFVILGTSHYGEPERFGLTRKPFVTPLGRAIPDAVLVDELAAAAPEAVGMEDYCHAIEHSIEFQVLFLQHLYGPGVRILPILCGSFAASLGTGGWPEDNGNVARFLDALGTIAAREGRRLFWVLGIDMAHRGKRYGDDFAARAGRDEMADTAAADRRRLERLSAGDAAGFWELVRENGDPLRWCGASPAYVLLKALPGVRGELLCYRQWNIDEQSVVTFAGMTFRTGAG